MLTEQGGLAVLRRNFLGRRWNIQLARESTASFDLYMLSIYATIGIKIYIHWPLKSLFIDICTGKAQHNVYMINRRIEYS